MFKTVLILLFLTTPALAQSPVAYDYCDELWFIRNQIYDNAGHCFSSPLGQAMFDNEDCTPGAVALSSFEQAMVDSLRAEEQSLGCAVDTAQTTPLAVPNLEDRRETPWLGGEMSYSMCIGWQGAGFALYAEPDAASTQIGAVTPGDNLSVIVSTSGAAGAWFYYYVMQGSDLRLEGWADHDLDWSRCDSNAG